MNLKATSVGPYAESDTTSALMIAWNWTDRPQDEIEGCYVVDDRPVSNTFAELAEHVAAGGTVVAHNAPFELAIWAMLRRRLPGVWPELTAKQTHDTMALGRALALPASLDKMARALRVSVVKDDVGHKLMMQMCKPRKPAKGEDKTVLHWHEAPEQMERLFAYCKTDVVVERRLWDMLPKLSPTERAVWELDNEINARGINLDLDGVSILSAAVAVEKEALENELHAITGGSVGTANSAKAFLAWLALQGYVLPDMRKDTIAATLKRVRHPLVKRALEIRQICGKASTSKLKAMTKRAMRDGRARGLLQYHGAATGRWAGSGIQPQNMPRTPDEFGPPEAEDALSWFKAGCPEIPAALWGSVHAAASYSLRAMICAAPGALLYCADYSNIEGRVVAWLADEHWKLDAFRALDAGTGHDLYKLAFAASFGVAPEDVTKPQRQIGKVQELALQYQGAHGAFLSMGKNYDVDLDLIATTVKGLVSPELWGDVTADYWAGARESAEEVLEERRLEALRDVENDEEQSEFEPDFFDVMSECAKSNRHGLGAEQWAALRIVIDNWRRAHEGTTALWKTLERAAIQAIEVPGEWVRASKVAYIKTGDFLLCRLPSGRCLSYPYAKVHVTTRIFKNAEGVEKEWKTKKLEFEGVDAKSKKWGRQFGYGGLLVENISQAISRDLLADAMLRLAAKEWAIVLHVHDEIVAEMPDGLASLEEFNSIIRTLPEWARGLPVDVAGWEGVRYRK